jgi:hypothetical protein
MATEKVDYVVLTKEQEKEYSGGKGNIPEGKEEN